MTSVTGEDILIIPAAIPPEARGCAVWIPSHSVIVVDEALPLSERAEAVIRLFRELLDRGMPLQPIDPQPQSQPARRRDI